MTPPRARAATTPPPGLEIGEEPGSFAGALVTEKLASGLGLLIGDGNRKLNAQRVEAMRLDYQVTACLLVLTQPMIRADWEIECEDPDVAEFVRAAHEDVHVDLMRSASRALWAGRSPNVLVWDYSERTGGLVVSKVRDLPPFTCQPVLDPSGAYAGFVQDRGLPTEITLDQEKILQTLWLVEGMESGNLLGRSVLTAALDPFLQKSAVGSSFLPRRLERFGEPVVVVRHPSGQVIANQAAINEAALKQQTDPGVQIPAPIYASYQQIAKDLADLGHHSRVTLDSKRQITADGKDVGYDWNIEYLESKAGGTTDFLDAITQYDKAIARAMFIPDLTFGNSDSGAYALGREHRSIFDAAMEGRLDDVATQLDRHYLRRLVEFNFGAGAPRARLRFAPIADTDRAKRWELVAALVAKGVLHPDVRALAEDLGIPLDDDAQDATEEAPQGPVEPPAPTEGTDPAPLARERLYVGHGHAVVLAGGGDVSGLPAYKVPQAYDPPKDWHRAFTPREKRIPFARLESELNATEAATIDAITELLGISRDRVLAQVKGIMGKGTLAEVIAAIATLDVGSPNKQVAAWTELLRSVWGLGLDSVRTELEEYADLVPAGLGAEARAMAATYATASAERHLAQLSTELRLSMLNAVTSGTSLVGVQAILADVYEKELTSEGKPLRLTTRMLTAKGLNEGRRDAIERGGIPLRGAQYSALLDRRTCSLCERQDEQVIGVESPDLRRFTPPVHHNCRCVWVWITRDELDFTPTWSSPPASLVDANGGLVIG